MPEGTSTSGSLTDRIPEIVRIALATESTVAADAIMDAMSLGDDLGLDSLEVLQAVMWIEDDIGVEVPDEDIKAAGTVGDLIEAVRKSVG